MSAEMFASWGTTFLIDVWSPAPGKIILLLAGNISTFVSDVVAKIFVITLLLLFP